MINLHKNRASLFRLEWIIVRVFLLCMPSQTTRRLFDSFSLTKRRVSGEAFFAANQEQIWGLRFDEFISKFEIVNYTQDVRSNGYRFEHNIKRQSNHKKVEYEEKVTCAYKMVQSSVFFCNTFFLI